MAKKTIIKKSPAKKSARKASFPRPSLKLPTVNFSKVFRSSWNQTVAPLRGAKLPPRIRRLPFAKNLTFGAVALLIFLALGSLGLFLFGNNLVLAWQQHNSAAVVNGESISRGDLEHRLTQSYGPDMTQQLIDETLIFQEARKQKVTVTKADIDAQISQIEKRLPGSLDEALKAKNLTREDLDRIIRLQVVTDKILGKDVTVSDQEIKDYFDKNKDSLAQSLNKKPDEIILEQVRDQIVQNLRQAKVQAKTAPWLEDLRAKSNIKTFIGS